MRLAFFSSLRFRLILLCVLLAIIPLGLVGGILTWQTYQVQQQQVLTFTQQVTNQRVRETQNFLRQVIQQLQVSAELVNLPRRNQQEQQQIFAQLIAQDLSIEEISSIGLDGTEYVRVARLNVFTADDLRNRRDEETFQQVISTGRPAYGAVLISATTGEPIMQLAVPVLDIQSGKISLVISADVRLKLLWDLVKNVQFSDQSSVTTAIVDHRGQVVAHSDPSIVLRQTILNEPTTEGILPGMAGEEALRTVEAFPVGDSIFYALAEMTVREAYAPANRSLMTALGLLAITAVVAITIGMGTVYQIVRPIQALADGARAISAGDLTRRIHAAGRDEVGALAQAFSIMVERLRSTLSTLEQRVTERTAALQAALGEAETARGQLAEQLALTEQQREVIREMSVPVLPVSNGTLVMPLVGALDSDRLVQIQEQALNRIETAHARRLLLDITGVPVVDSQVAQGLVRVVQAARLLGADVALVGIRPEVAQSIVGLGLDLSTIRTHSDLREALGHKGGTR